MGILNSEQMDLLHRLKREFSSMKSEQNEVHKFWCGLMKRYSLDFSEVVDFISEKIETANNYDKVVSKNTAMEEKVAKNIEEKKAMLVEMENLQEENSKLKKELEEFKESKSKRESKEKEISEELRELRETYNSVEKEKNEAMNLIDSQLKTIQVVCDERDHLRTDYEASLENIGKLERQVESMPDEALVNELDVCKKGGTNQNFRG